MTILKKNLVEIAGHEKNGKVFTFWGKFGDNLTEWGTSFKKVAPVMCIAYIKRLSDLVLSCYLAFWCP